YLYINPIGVDIKIKRKGLILNISNGDAFLNNRQRIAHKTSRSNIRHHPLTSCSLLTLSRKRRGENQSKTKKKFSEPLHINLLRGTKITISAKYIGFGGGLEEGEAKKKGSSSAYFGCKPYFATGSLHATLRNCQSQSGSFGLGTE